MQLGHQYGIAAMTGAVAASVTAVLQTIGTVRIDSVGTHLPYALAFAIVVGAVSGALTLGGVHAARLGLRSARLGRQLAAAIDGVVALVIGLAITSALVVGLLPDIAAYVWPVVAASVLGAIGVYYSRLWTP